MSRSLNALIAARSSGVAKSAALVITETRYCIVDHLLWSGGAPRGRPRSPLLRTPLPRSDTTSRISFGTFGTPVAAIRQVAAEVLDSRSHDDFADAGRV
jgi:hypothetical protein